MAVPNEGLLSEDIVYTRRIDMIARHMDIGAGVVLEIGAFDRPTFVPEDGKSYFLDYMSQADLKEKGAVIGRNIDEIPQMDYVITSNHLSMEVNKKFDLVVANHVIEHIPNPIEWLSEIGAILEDSGYLFLSVPDKRYTFDYLRKETDFLELIQRFRDGYAKPDFWKIAEARFLERPQIAGEMAWHKHILDDLLAQGGRTVLESLAMAKDEVLQPYVDIHCNVFTFASFCTLFAQIEEARLSPLELVEVTDVLPGKIEFHAILRKRPSFDRSGMTSLLATIPPRDRDC